MTDIVKLRRDDGKNLETYHKELGKLQFDTLGLLEDLITYGTHPAQIKKAEFILKLMEPATNFFIFGEVRTSGIQPLDDACSIIEDHLAITGGL